ncbi:hypothetical protein LOK49_LG07G01360 [Camellia lanceoleosa]|uniref:Uncharacterized protein n=1 Tax=Camellia lanceoleosa TaxID=1840588 RepID=A0ACC0H0L4_9ERIC|nr:hypothetical protein LOK49_LG07G01360 [Camellia lanceoleosa]
MEFNGHDACRLQRAPCQSLILCCVQCNLNLHVECIPALQNTAKVETHRHLLTLTDPLPEDDTDEYYCSVCEKERNPKHSVYYCAKCDFVTHIECGFPDLKVVSPLEEESYEEEEPSVVQQLVDAGLDPFREYDIEEYCARATDAEGASDDEDTGVASTTLDSLPRGIIQARSDLELKPLWSKSSSKSKVNVSSSHNLLAIPLLLVFVFVFVYVKESIDLRVRKCLRIKKSNQHWRNKSIRVTRNGEDVMLILWFAKRFMHAAVVSLYNYIFLWDEDLGVENFHPRRYLKILKSEGLEISQPALGPNSTEIHHKITARVRTNKFHRRVWDVRGSAKCLKMRATMHWVCRRNGSSIFKICLALCLASYTEPPLHMVIGMPALSPTMTQGNIAKWRKREGEKVPDFAYSPNPHNGSPSSDKNNSESEPKAKVVRRRDAPPAKPTHSIPLAASALLARYPLNCPLFG